MTETVQDVLKRMRPYVEASGAAVEVFFIDSDFGVAELLLRSKPGVTEDDLRSVQYSIEQMILRKAGGIRQVEFLPDDPALRERETEPETPEPALDQLSKLRAGTDLALQMLASLEQTLRDDAADRTLREIRQAHHFLNGPYPKWAADARERFRELDGARRPKDLLRGLRDIFPAVDRTTRALTRVVEGERVAWKASDVPLRENTSPYLMLAQAREDFDDLLRILAEVRPHLGDRTLADFDGGEEADGPADSRPTTHLLDRIFRDAAQRRVRDVYIEAGESSALLRYRVGREIKPVVEFPRALFRSLLARLKHLASLDVSERRRRQEGHIRFSDASGYNGLHVQVQTIPDRFGERVRLRLHIPASLGGRT